MTTIAEEKKFKRVLRYCRTIGVDVKKFIEWHEEPSNLFPSVWEKENE